jgi:hypothetical protein
VCLHYPNETKDIQKDGVYWQVQPALFGAITEETTSGIGKGDDGGVLIITVYECGVSPPSHPTEVVNGLRGWVIDRHGCWWWRKGRG